MASGETLKPTIRENSITLACIPGEDDPAAIVQCCGRAAVADRVIFPLLAGGGVRLVGVLGAGDDDDLLGGRSHGGSPGRNGSGGLGRNGGGGLGRQPVRRRPHARRPAAAAQLRRAILPSRPRFHWLEVGCNPFAFGDLVPPSSHML